MDKKEVSHLMYSLEQSTPEAQLHCSRDLEHLFNACFMQAYHTILCGGADEPLYQPAQEHTANHNSRHVIYYRHDYFASALHEIAHWCIAGEKRRTQLDYGYWYASDGRDMQQQAQFEQVEVKPQAIEWAFSQACNKPFRVSIDNLNGAASNEHIFTQNVKKQLVAYQKTGFPERANLFLHALHDYYHTQNHEYALEEKA